MQYFGDSQLDQFYHKWMEMCSNMLPEDVPQDNWLRDCLYKKIRHSNLLLFDIEQYESWDEGDYRRTYRHLRNVIERAIARVKEDKQSSARDKYARDYAGSGKRTTPAPATPTPKIRARSYTCAEGQRETEGQAEAEGWCRSCSTFATNKTTCQGQRQRQRDSERYQSIRITKSEGQEEDLTVRSWWRLCHTWGEFGFLRIKVKRSSTTIEVNNSLSHCDAHWGERPNHSGNHLCVSPVLMIVATSCIKISWPRFLTATRRWMRSLVSHCGHGWEGRRCDQVLARVVGHRVNDEGRREHLWWQHRPGAVPQRAWSSSPVWQSCPFNINHQLQEKGIFWLFTGCTGKWWSHDMSWQGLPKWMCIESPTSSTTWQKPKLRLWWRSSEISRWHVCQWTPRRVRTLRTSLSLRLKRWKEEHKDGKNHHRQPMKMSIDGHWCGGKIVSHSRRRQFVPVLRADWTWAFRMHKPGQRCDQERAQCDQRMHDGNDGGNGWHTHTHGPCQRARTSCWHSSWWRGDLWWWRGWSDGRQHVWCSHLHERGGDWDELGQFWIAGQRVDEGGPTTRSQIDAVLRADARWRRSVDGPGVLQAETRKRNVWRNPTLHGWILQDRSKECQCVPHRTAWILWCRLRTGLRPQYGCLWSSSELEFWILHCAITLGRRAVTLDLAWNATRQDGSELTHCWDMTMCGITSPIAQSRSSTGGIMWLEEKRLTEMLPDSDFPRCSRLCTTMWLTEEGWEYRCWRLESCPMLISMHRTSNDQESRPTQWSLGWFVVGANCRESPFGAHAYQQLVRGQTSNGVPLASTHTWSSDDDAFELSRDFTWESFRYLWGGTCSRQRIRENGDFLQCVRTWDPRSYRIAKGRHIDGEKAAFYVPTGFNGGIWGENHWQWSTRHIDGNSFR